MPVTEIWLFGRDVLTAALKQSGDDEDQAEHVQAVELSLGHDGDGVDEVCSEAQCVATLEGVEVNL